MAAVSVKRSIAYSLRCCCRRRRSCLRSLFVVTALPELFPVIVIVTIIIIIILITIIMIIVMAIIMMTKITKDETQTNKGSPELKQRKPRMMILSNLRWISVCYFLFAAFRFLLETHRYPLYH